MRNGGADTWRTEECTGFVACNVEIVSGSCDMTIAYCIPGQTEETQEMLL